MKMPPLMACPLCSVPPRLVVRIYLVLGARSKMPIIAGCPHVSDVFPGRANCAESADALAQQWNAWAAEMTAEKLGHLPVDDPWRMKAEAALKAE